MTELEKELQATVKLQEEIFSRELRKVSSNYEKSLASIVKAYNEQMKEAIKVIEKQKDTIEMQRSTLERYKNISKDLTITLDKEPIVQLENLFNEQGRELEVLKQQLAELQEAL